MPNKRIRKKRELWRRPLRRIEISEADAIRKLDRLVQRSRRHHECYIIVRADGERVALFPYAWYRSTMEYIERMKAQNGLIRKRLDSMEDAYDRAQQGVRELHEETANNPADV